MGLERLINCWCFSAPNSMVQEGDSILGTGIEAGRKILRPLSGERLARFARDGVIFPIRVLTAGELTAFKTKVEEVEARILGRAAPSSL